MVGVFGKRLETRGASRAGMGKLILKTDVLIHKCEDFVRPDTVLNLSV